MRLPSQITLLTGAIALVLAFLPPGNVLALSPVHEGGQPPLCESMASSPLVCASQRGEVHYYRLGSPADRPVRVVVVGGEVAVLPSQATVQVTLASAAGPATWVYQDETLKIGTLRNAQNPSTWVVQPRTPASGSAKNLCAAPHCGGNQILLVVK